MSSIPDPQGWPEWAKPFRPGPPPRSPDDDHAGFVDALLDVVFGPATVPPGDGASTRPAPAAGAAASDPIDDLENFDLAN